MPHQQGDTKRGGRLRPSTMFVADKEGKRISAHDKLRLYEFQPQVSSDSNTHTHSKNADLKSHEYLATRKSIQSQLDWSSWWKRMKKIDRHWWCVSYWILICCNLDCLEQCILCCQYSLNISTRSRLVQAQVGKQTCVYSWIMAVFFIDYLSATSRNHILPKNMDA